MILKMKIRLSLILLISICSCSFSTDSISPILNPGIYTTCKLSNKEKLKYNLKYRSDFFHGYLLGLNLKKDSTFYITFCNRKIAVIGNWATKSDTLYLTNILRLKDKMQLPNMQHFIKDSFIFFNYGTNYQKLNGYGNITLLKIGGENFDGMTNDSSMNIKDTLHRY